jgi:hypothetical protein
MGQIFENAQQVLSFIPQLLDGQSDSQSPRLVRRSMLAIGAALDADRQGLLPSADALDPLGEISGTHGDLTCRSLVEEAVDLCQAEYWTRTWIVQEISLAREVTITDGFERVSWKALQHRLKEAGEQKDLSPSEQYMLGAHIPSRLNDMRTGRRRSSLAALLSDFAQSRCTDFHDKVYGLLSLAYNGHYYQIDYRLDHWGLFHRTLQFCLDRGSLVEEEFQLFPTARTLARALVQASSLFLDMSEGDEEKYVLPCRAMLSTFTLVDETDTIFSNSVVECRYCRRRAARAEPPKGSLLFCLADEGTTSHMLFSPTDGTEEIGDARTEIVMTFPPEDEGCPRASILYVVFRGLPQLDEHGLYHVVHIWPTTLLAVMREEWHETMALDDMVDRLHDGYGW